MLKNNAGPRGGCTFVMLTITIVLCLLIYAGVSLFVHTRARAADLEIVPLGHSRLFTPTITDSFGTYTPAYYQRRWKKLCKGGGRYEAMSEAYELGMRDPCQGMRME